MHFDWYQATIDAPAQVILDAAMASLDGAHEVEHIDRGGSGYKASAAIRDRRGDMMAFMLHGSKSAAPNLRGSSHHAEPIASFIREHYPVHAVSRVDVAEDMTAPDLFESLKTVMQRISTAHGLESGLSIIPDTAERGSTYYVGSDKSATRVRLYQKDFERASKGEIALAEADPDLTRLEIQCRPQKKAKRMFATKTTEEAWGASKWTQHLASVVLKLDVERLNLRPREESDLERTTAQIVHQYRKHAIKHGTVISRMEDGLVMPSARDAIEAFAERLKTDMLREHEIRTGAYTPPR